MLINNLVLFLPLLTVLILGIFPNRWLNHLKWVSVGSALSLLTLNLISRFGLERGIDLSFLIPYYDFFLDFGLNLDSPIVYLFILNNILFLLATLGVLPEKETNSRFVHISLSLLYFSLNFAFLSQNYLSFYLSLEVLFLITFFIYGQLANNEQERKNVFFWFIGNSVSSILFLIALTYLSVKSYIIHGNAILTIDSINSMGVWNDVGVGEKTLLFWTFLVALLIRSGVFPFQKHFIKPIFLANKSFLIYLLGLIQKVGLFGVLIFILPAFSEEAESHKTLLILFSIFGALYSFGNAWLETERNRVLAYLSLGQLSLIGAGFFTGEAIALKGGIEFLMIHTLAFALMVYILPIRGRNLDRRLMFLILIFTLLGFPLSPSFTRLTMLFTGLFEQGIAVGGLGAIAFFLSLLSFLRFYQNNNKFDQRMEMNLTEILNQGLCLCLMGLLITFTFLEIV